jgi:hypothetical protein
MAVKITLNMVLVREEVYKLCTSIEHAGMGLVMAQNYAEVQCAHPRLPPFLATGSHVKVIVDRLPTAAGRGRQPPPNERSAPQPY